MILSSEMFLRVLVNGVDAFAPLNKSGTQIGAANLFIPGSPPHLPASANFNKINKNKLPYFFFFSSTLSCQSKHCSEGYNTCG